MKLPITRREFLIASAAGSMLARFGFARADEPPVAALQPLVQKITAGATITKGRVAMDIAPYADNGQAVPLTVSVDCAMNESEYVRTIHVLSEKNPRPVIAVFHMNPRCGRARISTRIRLNGAQRLLVLAELSNQTWWYATADVVVTSTACLDES